MILPTNDYSKIYRATPFPSRVRPDTEYGLCLRTALWKTIVLTKDRGPDWPINVVMEGGHRNEGDAARVFFEVKDSLRPEFSKHLGTISFASKTDCLPLAMADSLAYAIFRHTTGYSSHPTIPNAAPVGPADPPYYVGKIPLSRTLIDDTTLKRLRAELMNL